MNDDDDISWKRDYSGYCTHLDGTYSAQLITVTQPEEDLERTGIIVEALNAYSREFSIPNIYDGFRLSPINALRSNIQKGSESITSFYEANKASCEKWIVSMIEAFNESEN